ncbi:MAG: glycosyl transferase family protein [Pseudomonadota bacterium]
MDGADARDPREALAPFVRAMARGPSRGRGLTRDEARAAATSILSGEAAPEAVGALFMLMRYRGESAGEIAGFVEAMRARIEDWRDVGAAVDWPSYAAGRTRGAPLFLMSARLVAASGRPVLIHGWNSHLVHPVTTAAGVAALGAPVARSPAEARAALSASGIAYVPLDALDGEALRLLQLRQVLGLRSPLNTVLRALNPAGAPATVQGVFHPSYRALQTEAASLLGQLAIGVVKGGGGEFERHPGKAVELYGYAAEGAFDRKMPATMESDARRLKADGADVTPEAFTALWTGARRDPFEEAAVIATAGAALYVAGAAPDLAGAEALATELWENRTT